MDIVKLQIQKKRKELLFLFSKVYSGGLRGIDGYVVQVEADVSDGLPGFYMVGSLASEVREAEERVRTAMRNAGFHLSARKITVNLSPANVRKEGTACDLPVAIAVLAAYGIVMPSGLKQTGFLGELGLDGKIKPVRGVLSMVLAMAEKGLERCFLPEENVEEGVAADCMEIVKIRNLQEVVEFLNEPDRICFERASDLSGIQAAYGVDFCEVNGQKLMRRATEVAVAGGHNLLYIGPPGSGKSMSIKAMLGLLDKNFSVSGHAWFGEKDLLKESGESMRKIRGSEIAVVLQNPMTCFDPLYRIGSQIGETFATHTDWNANEIREKSLETLERMRIRNPEETLQKYPHQLSGGMLQRIMIGIAMALKPALLIADEPTTAIDSITQYEILEEFVRIKKEHDTAMIFITHDLGAISKVADDLVVMNSGTIADRGSFSHILHHASDPYTRLLVEKRSAVMKKYRESIGHENGGAA